jgi:hypothetical protein
VTDPKKIDTADLLAQGRLSEFQEIISRGVSDLDYLLLSLANPVPLANRDRLLCADRLISAIQPIKDPALREMSLEDIADWIGLKLSWLKPRLKLLDDKARDDEKARGGKPVDPAAPGDPHERELVERDHGFHRGLINRLKSYIAEKKLIPDAVGGWMRATGGARISIKHRDLVDGFFFKFAAFFESLPRERIDMTLRAMVMEQREARRVEILARITGKPSTDRGRAELRKWVRAVTGKEDPTDIGVIEHFMWQTKRLNTEKRTEWDLMPILRGMQGSGKSTAVRLLISVMQELCLTINAKHLTDDRSFEVLSDYAIGFWDEMAGGTRAEIESLKHTLSAVDVNYRELGGHNHNLLTRRMAIIAATNLRVKDIIADTTGARRYYEVNCLDVIDHDAINSIDPFLCWECVSEDDPAPIHDIHQAVKLRQAELVHQDIFDAWQEYENTTGWAELQLLKDGVPFDQGAGAASPRERIRAYEDTRPRDDHGKPTGEARGWTFHEIDLRFAYFCRMHRQSAKLADWVAKRLSQAGWETHRPAGKGFRPTYYRKPPLPTPPATAAAAGVPPAPSSPPDEAPGPSRGEKFAAEPSPAEDRFQSEAGPSTDDTAFRSPDGPTPF